MTPKNVKYWLLGFLIIFLFMLSLAFWRWSGKGKYFGYPDGGADALEPLPFDPNDPNLGPDEKPMVKRK